MIAVDTNLLVYAHRRDTEWHEKAAEIVASLAHGNTPWALPWSCIHEFLAVVTHRRIFEVATPVELATDQLRAWMESPSLVLLAEGPGYFDSLSSLLNSAKPRGPRIHDARIAAICINHGVSELWTADRDFLQFPSIKVRNPLVA